jgi:predicted nucleic acid-binding protein
MIVLDTNVVSETMRALPQSSVIEWLDSQDEAELFICAPVLAELRYGEELLPAGRRRTALSVAIDHIEQHAFRGRILPFDQAAASIYARLAAIRKQKGLPLNQMDGLIAAIAVRHGASLCSRDENGFVAFGLTVINPFSKPEGGR